MEELKRKHNVTTAMENGINIARILQENGLKSTHDVAFVKLPSPGFSSSTIVPVPLDAGGNPIPVEGNPLTLAAGFTGATPSLGALAGPSGVTVPGGLLNTGNPSAQPSPNMQALLATL
jgi:hypothetical protein